MAKLQSVAKRRGTPGNGEEENQALEGRQIIQIKGILFSRPCWGLSCLLIINPGVTRRAAALHPRLLLLWRLRRKMPRYKLQQRIRRKKVNGIGRGRRRSRAASRLFSLRFFIQQD